MIEGKTCDVRLLFWQRNLQILTNHSFEINRGQDESAERRTFGFAEKDSASRANRVQGYMAQKFDRKHQFPVVDKGIPVFRLHLKITLDFQQQHGCGTVHILRLEGNRDPFSNRIGLELNAKFNGDFSIGRIARQNGELVNPYLSHKKTNLFHRYAT